MTSKPGVVPTIGGACLGLAFGILTRLVLKFMHRRGHKAPEQRALTVAMAYLAFYVANGPCARPGPLLIKLACDTVCATHLPPYFLYAALNVC